MTQPVFFAVDAAKRINRAWITVPLVLGTLFGSGTAMIGYEGWDWRSPLDWLTVASFAGLMIFVTAAPLLRTQRADDWLKLDAGGLTVSQRGRRRYWQWSRLADVKRHRWYHPATPLLGRFITIRVTDASREQGLPNGLKRMLLPRGRIAIGNDYMTPINRIAAWLPAYMAREAASQTDQKEGPDADGPVLIKVRPDPKHTSRWKKSISTILAFIVGCGGGFTLLALAENGGDWQGVDWRQFATIALPTITGVVMGLPHQISLRSAAQNFLLFSDDGLHIRERGHRKHWSWREISGYRLERAGVSTQVGEARHPAKYITLDAARDGTKPWEAGPAKATAVTIEDRYEAPIEEIARQIGLWRERGRVVDATPLEADGFVLNEAPEPGDGMVTFGRRFPADKFDSITAAMVVVSQIAFIGWLAYTLWWLGQPHEAAEASSDLVAYASIGLTILIPISLFSIPMLALLPGINYLRLEPTGVVLARMGIKRRWPWAGISGVELRTGKFFWRKQGRSYVSFAVRRDDPLSRFARWCYGVSRARPTVILEDIYDTRPEALARALTERWNRGQRMGGAR